MSEFQQIELFEISSEQHVQQIISRIMSEMFLISEMISPYGVAKIINKVFQELNIEKQIAPQMMYNYARNKLIVKNSSAKRYSHGDVFNFVVRYVERNI